MQERKLRMAALETVCYVAGAGAFSVFIRWLQTMLAYNDEGLVDKSFFNILVPGIAIAAAFLFRHIINKFKKERYYLSDDFFEVFRNDGKGYQIFRVFTALVMIGGSLMLLTECEVDREVKFLKILAVMGIVTGICVPLLLSCANKPHVTKPAAACLLSAVPVVFFCFWLVTCYKINAINPVLWDYAMDIITVIICILSFFYIAGFPFSVQKPWRAMFFSMLGGALCMMMMADDRYMGMEFMLLGAAMMQIYNVWVMVCNMRQKEKEFKVQPEDGFEHLNKL